MFFLRFGFAIASLLLSATVSAQVTDNKIQTTTDKLTLRDAIAATLTHNPQLGSFSLRRDAAAGELQTAGLKPGLRLSTELENIGGTGELKDSQSAELTLALSSVIELGNKREARMGVATERQQQLTTQQEIAELDLLAETTRRFIEVAEAQEQVNLQQSTLVLATETANAIKRRIDIGNTPDAELARAKANQARTAIVLQRALASFETAKIKLAALWGETTPAFAAVSADLLNPGNMRPLNDLLAGLEENPDIQLFASESRLRDAELRLALSRRKADLEWSAGVRHLQESKDSALVMGVSVPLFNNNRAIGEVASARANQQITERERDAALLNLRAQLAGLYREREAALFEMASLRNEVIPQLKKAASGTRAAFDKGRYGYLELSAAQRELLEAEAALISAAANSHQLRAEIERLSGNATSTRRLPLNSEIKP
ncbi:MAG TPA: TolC family protein [Cellvibrio sp.]|nr:TolC family protein [Cellvibrio sp.]